MIMLAELSFLTIIGSFAMIGVCLFLIALILLQKNRGSGLSGAFGGAGGHSAFGTKTGDFLTWVTVGTTAAFLLLAILLNFGYEPEALTTPAIGATPAANTTPTGEAADPGAATPVSTPPAPEG